MAERFTIRWEVEDGYVGGARPQETTISPLVFEDETDEEITAALMEVIQDDFQAKITFRVPDAEIARVVGLIRAALTKAE